MHGIPGMCLVGLAAVVFSEGQKVGEEEECRDGQLRPPHVEREDVAGWGAVVAHEERGLDEHRHLNFGCVSR